MRNPGARTSTSGKSTKDEAGRLSTKPELWNVVTKTYPDVSQFWTYGKDKFLAQPVYDRNFPPCKYCE